MRHKFFRCLRLAARLEEFPTPIFDDWLDPLTFREAMELHMRRHGDSYWHLYRAVVRDDEKLDHSTIRHWLQGSKAPRLPGSVSRTPCA
ncbi:hypothetical protein [Chelativorans sp. M5D2P16]|uniref:hypothetical protein n=1 Tax=Chelativorans sp. M5D2P16 TaxID=3095678 RepID=UPI002ACA2D22|nr:hypothetical protein [Chelativorans sp. M5D2P16]MDZ5696658.1 hypothetical protein [Chelativorans sp. M5D2P16]